MSETLEKRHEQLQVRLLIGVAVGMLGLTASEFLKQIETGGGWSVGVSVFTLLGWLIFIIAFFQLRRLGTVDTDGQFAKAVFDDELSRWYRLQAFQFAIGAVLAVQVTLILGAPLLERLYGFTLSVPFAANLTIVTVVLAGLGRFLYLNRADA